MKRETAIVAIAGGIVLALTLSTTNAGAQCCGWGIEQGAADTTEPTADRVVEPVRQAKEVAKPQTTCPVTGDTIDKKLYVDANGHRIYVCCAGCLEPVKAAPEKYLARIRANGETPARIPRLICAKCGELKGSEACCAKGAKACAKCGLHKGAPGCCRITKGGPDVEVCDRCNGIKGSAACCKDRAKPCAGKGRCGGGGGGNCGKHGD